jgi:hypothetical protein
VCFEVPKPFDLAHGPPPWPCARVVCSFVASPHPRQMRGWWHEGLYNTLWLSYCDAVKSPIFNNLLLDWLFYFVCYSGVIMYICTTMNDLMLILGWSNALVLWVGTSVDDLILGLMSWYGQTDYYVRWLIIVTIAVIVLAIFVTNFVLYGFILLPNESLWLINNLIFLN